MHCVYFDDRAARHEATPNVCVGLYAFFIGYLRSISIIRMIRLSKVVWHFKTDASKRSRRNVFRCFVFVSDRSPPARERVSRYSPFGSLLQPRRAWLQFRNRFCISTNDYPTPRKRSRVITINRKTLFRTRNVQDSDPIQTSDDKHRRSTSPEACVWRFILVLKSTMSFQTSFDVIAE